jgi:hypothetical protein
MLLGRRDPKFYIKVDSGRGQHRLKWMWTDAIDYMSVSLEHLHHLTRPPVPDENVATVRPRHDIVAAPKCCFVDHSPAVALEVISRKIKSYPVKLLPCISMSNVFHPGFRSVYESFRSGETSSGNITLYDSVHVNKVIVRFVIHRFSIPRYSA